MSFAEITNEFSDNHKRVFPKLFLFFAEEICLFYYSLFIYGRPGYAVCLFV